MAHFGGLDVAPPTRNYIGNDLNPLLLDIVSDLVTDSPPDPTDYAIQWLQSHPVLQFDPLVQVKR